MTNELDEARAAVGKAWFAGGKTLAEAIRFKCSTLERWAEPVRQWPPKRGILRKRDARWHFGTWIAPGLHGGGSASVDVWRAASGECLVGIHASANLTVEQARMIGEALLAAADCAAAEDASGVGP